MTDVKKGDEVSWNWGGGAPGGIAKDVKPDEVQMETKRGNTVTKQGEEGNPAVYVEREGHDVVKKASELNVEEAGPEHKGEGVNGDKKGLEVPKKGKGRSKSRSPAPAAKKEEDEPAEEKKEEDEQEAPKEKNKKAQPKKKAAAAATAAAEKKDEKKEDEKKKPARKPKNEAKTKAEKPKKRAATDSGEPRRSKRNKA